MEARRLPFRTALAALAIAAVAAPAAHAATDDATAIIGAGTLVGGVDVGGQSITQATATLEAQLAPKLLAPVTVRIGSRRFQLGGRRAGVVLDADRTARRAYYAARDAAATTTPVPPATTTPAPTTTTAPATRQAGGATSGISVPIAVTVSRDKVDAWAAKVTKSVTRPARSAALKIGVTKMRVTKAKRGVSVDTGSLATAVRAAFADPVVDRTNLRQPLTAVEPQTSLKQLRAANETILTVDRSNYRLRVFKNLKLSKSYDIALGKAGHDTPSGTYSIANKAVDPAWHVPNSDWAGSLAGSVVPGGAPENPLKARWLGIVDGVGIHGTAEEWSIGTSASHGCIRMRVADVIDLYPRVPVGAKVLIS